MDADRSYSAPGAKRFEDWFAAARFHLAVLTVIALALAARVIVWPLCRLIEIQLPAWASPEMGRDQTVKMMLLGLVIAPLAESLVCQMLVFRFATKLRMFPAHPWITIVVSAAFFGAMHYYGGAQILSATGVGFVLAWAFCSAGAGTRAYWVVTCAHAGLNLVPFTLAFIE